ncbi:MAG: crossover junction endodeoxyribonuclease RuvC [Bacteroidota bacterium]
MSLTENKIYRILGVDPGTVKMGYALLEINGSQMKSVDIGVIFPGCPQRSPYEAFENSGKVTKYHYNL